MPRVQPIVIWSGHSGWDSWTRVGTMRRGRKLRSRSSPAAMGLRITSAAASSPAQHRAARSAAATARATRPGALRFEHRRIASGSPLEPRTTILVVASSVMGPERSGAAIEQPPKNMPEIRCRSSGTRVHRQSVTPEVPYRLDRWESRHAYVTYRRGRLNRQKSRSKPGGSTSGFRCTRRRTRPTRVEADAHAASASQR